MIKMGVDPANLEQVGAFLQKLQQTDPDLLVLFENAMNSLDPMKDTATMAKKSASPLAPPQMPGQEGMPPQIPGQAEAMPPGQAQPGLMDQKTQNIQQQMMR